MTASTSFLAELKRRNVIRVAIAYVAVSWLALQAGTLIVETLELPKALSKGLFVLLAIGFIPTLLLSWIFELTPGGLKRESESERDESAARLTGRKLDRVVIGVLGAAVMLLLVDRFLLLPRKAAKPGASESAGASAQPDAGAARQASQAAPAQASIAVLPFVNMSEDKANEYFADGISEELLNLLARIPQLQVTARTSSFSFKGKDVPIPEIAKTLRVAHVLEGSVRKAGDRVRITAQLVDASSDKHLWSQSYHRKLDDVFAIQDEIAADVVRALEVTLLGEAPKTRTTNPEAYALYLQANELARPNTLEAFAASDALLRRALELDPKYVPAWDGLTRNAINRTLASASASTDQTEQLWGDARRAADQALAVDPDFARTHGRLGSIAMNCCGDLRGAVQHYQRALSLDASDPVVLANTTTLLGRLGRVDQALGLQEAVLRRDPVNVTGLANLANLQRSAGRYDEAIATLRTVLSLAPSRRGARYGLGSVLLLKGDAQAALAEMEQEQDEIARLAGLSKVHHALGEEAKSDAMLATLVAKYEADWSAQIAAVHAFRGEADQAFAWLDKAIERNDPGLHTITLNRFYDRIRSDPRWLTFLRRIDKAPEQLAQIEFDAKIPPSIEDTSARNAHATEPPANPMQ